MGDQGSEPLSRCESFRTVVTRIWVAPKNKTHPQFDLGFWLQVVLKYNLIIPMFKTHPYIWCPILGQKGASCTWVDMVTCNHPYTCCVRPANTMRIPNFKLLSCGGYLIATAVPLVDPRSSRKTAEPPPQTLEDDLPSKFCPAITECVTFCSSARS